MTPFGGQDGGNPFVSGLVNAVNIAHAIQQQGIQRDTEARNKAREARAALDDTQAQASKKQDQEQRDISMQQGLTQAGAREATPADLIGSKNGTLENKLATYGGKQYVLPTKQQMEDQADEDYAKKAGRTAAAEGVKADITEQAKTKALNDRLASEGIVNEDANKALGWPAGTKVLPEHVAQVSAAVSARKKADQAAADLNKKTYKGIQTDDSGNATLIFNDGTTQKLGKIGKSKTEARDPNASPSNQRATEKAQTDSGVARVGAEIGLMDDVTDMASADAALRQKAKTDPFTKQNYLLIRKHLKDNFKTSAAETNADTVKSLLGDDSTDTPAAPAPVATPKAATAPAAKPQAAAAKTTAVVKGAKSFNKKTGETAVFDGVKWTIQKK